MNTNDAVKVYVPTGGSYTSFIESDAQLCKPFDEVLVDFVDAFSRRLFKDEMVRVYPDLSSLAFWMRKSQVLKLKADYQQQNLGRVKVARGMVFHVAPSNVDTIFIYSLFLSLLSGNKNIVRISSKGSDRQGVILRILNELLAEKFSVLAQTILILNYPHDEVVTTSISTCSDARIIWGGDETINQISRCLAKPTCVDLKFSNKYSYALLSVKSLKNATEDNFDQLVINFVNDSYWFGQQACSSPRTVIWLDPDNDEDTKEKFWGRVEKNVAEFDHGLETADFVNKLFAQQQAAIEDEIQFIDSVSNLVSRVRLKNKNNKSKALHCGSGLFYEMNINVLSELAGFFARNDQTLSYYGINMEELKSVLTENPTGIDRVVPVGIALEFSPVWDGYDFLQSLTREIQYK